MIANLVALGIAAGLGRIADRDQLTPAEVAQLSAVDPRIPGSLPVPGSITRIRRWMSAGSPAPDFSRLLYRGSDWARGVLLEVLRTVPAPVAWHAVEHVVFREAGSENGGWMARALTPRHPEGDQAHEVVVCGRTYEDTLASVYAHEIAHSYTRRICPHTPASEATTPERERTARTTLVWRDAGRTIEELVSERVADEQLADALSTLWSFERHVDELALRRKFNAEYTAAAELAAQIADEIDRTTGDAIAAATEGTPS